MKTLNEGAKLTWLVFNINKMKIPKWKNKGTYGDFPGGQWHRLLAPSAGGQVPIPHAATKVKHLAQLNRKINALKK